MAGIISARQQDMLLQHWDSIPAAVKTSQAHSAVPSNKMSGEIWPDEAVYPWHHGVKAGALILPP